MFFSNLKYINFINTQNHYFISSNEYYKELYLVMGQLDNTISSFDFLRDNYLLKKLVSLCTKKGNSKMAYAQVINALQLIKQFFRVNPFFILKRAVLQLQTFIFLHKIPRGKKIRYLPRILPSLTRVHNALYILTKLAFDNSTSFRNFYISLAHTIIDNSMPDNIYTKQTREITAIAYRYKRSIKNPKLKGRNIFIKIRRKERFKLFKKIKIKINNK